MWENLKSVLGKFKGKLTCILCEQLLNDPYTVSECGHNFCRNCIEDFLGSERKCPKCLLPAIFKNLKKNPAYDTIISCTSKLIEALEGENVPMQERKNIPVEEGNRTAENITVEIHIEKSQDPIKPRTPKTEEKKPKEKRKKIQTEKPKRIKQPTIEKENIPNTLPKKRNKNSEDFMRIDSEINYSQKRSIIISTTGLKPDEKDLLWSSCNIDASKKTSVYIVDNYDSSVTHIITSSNAEKICPRTLKYLLGILEGKWIVEFQWFLESLSKEEWVPELPFEIKGDLVSGPTEGPMKGRLSSAEMKGGLFKDLQFYLIGTFKKPSKADVQDLIRFGGGRLMNKKPTKKESNIIGIVDSEETKKHENEIFKVIPVSKILSCISNYSTDSIK